MLELSEYQVHLLISLCRTLWIFSGRTIVIYRMLSASITNTLFSIQAQNLPFHKYFHPYRLLAPRTALMDNHTGPVILNSLFSLHFPKFSVLVPCGRLSWLVATHQLLTPCKIILSYYEHPARAWSCISSVTAVRTENSIHDIPFSTCRDEWQVVCYRWSVCLWGGHCKRYRATGPCRAIGPKLAAWLLPPRGQRIRADFAGATGAITPAVKILRRRCPRSY